MHLQVLAVSAVLWYGSMALKCPKGPVTDYVCTGDDCKYCKLGCEEGVDCQVSCNGTSSVCRGMYLNCVDSASCELDCIGAGSCNGATVLCPADGDCNVRCDDDLSCKGVKVRQPRQGEQGDLTMQCGGFGSCGGADVQCPKDGAHCDVRCDGVKGCAGATVRRGDNSSLSLQCGDGLSCAGTTVSRHWGVQGGTVCMNCTGPAACGGSSVDCGGDANCVMDCQDKASCAMANLMGCSKFCSECEVLCRERGACVGVNLPTCRWSHDFLRIGCKTDCTKDEGKCDEVAAMCPSSGPPEPEPVTPVPRTLPPATPVPPPVGVCSGRYDGISGVYVCSGTACQDCEIPCMEGAACAVRCTDEGSCAEARFNCADARLCSIVCEAEEACAGATVTCPHAGACTANCLVEGSCESLAVRQPEPKDNGDAPADGAPAEDAPSAGDVSSASASASASAASSASSSSAAVAVSHISFEYKNKLAVNCLATSSCELSRLECPSRADCSVMCYGDSACDGVAVARGADGYTDLHVTCSGRLSCAGIDVSTKGDTGSGVGIGIGGTACVNCTGERACEGADLVCSDGGNCLLDCQGVGACNATAFTGCSNASTTCQAVCRDSTSCGGIDAPRCALPDPTPADDPASSPNADEDPEQPDAVAAGGSNLCLWNCFEDDSACSKAPSKCPPPTCRYFLPVNRSRTSFDECQHRCFLFTGEEKACFPNTGVEQLCRCEDGPPAPIPIPSGWKWVWRKVFRSLAAKKLLKDFVQQEFQWTLLRVLRGVVRAATVRWICPASACAFGRCPSTQADKLRRDCISAADVTRMDAQQRVARLLSSSEDESTIVEYDVTPAEGVSDDEAAAALEAASGTGELQEVYGIDGVEAAEAEVAMPDSSPANNNDKDDGASGLSGGSLAGIIVGCVVLAGIVAGVVYQRRSTSARRRGFVEVADDDKGANDETRKLF